jgi:hypothetical protein
LASDNIQADAGEDNLYKTLTGFGPTPPAKPEAKRLKREFSVAKTAHYKINSTCT